MMPDLSTAWTSCRHITSDQSPSSGIYWHRHTSSLMILPAAAAQAAASSTGPADLDALVAALALGLGAAAAVVLAVGCGLLTVAALGRALGRSLDGLDALAARLTPALLRRAVAVTVSTGLGRAAATGV